jgi:hypothetical protein
MRKLLSALTITLLLTVNTMADTLSIPDTSPAESTLVEVLLAIAIAIPNLLKSH